MKLLFWDDSVATVVITYGILGHPFSLIFVAKFARGLILGEKIPPSSVYLFRWFGFYSTQSGMRVIDQMQLFYQFSLQLKAQ